MKSGHITACRRRIGHRRRWFRESRIFLWSRLFKFPVCLKESNVEKERLCRLSLQKARCSRGNLGYVIALCLHHLIETDCVRVLRDMLNPDQGGMIAVRLQPMENVLLVVSQREPAVSQAKHSVVMRTVTRQQRCPAWRASRGCVKRLP